MTGIGALGSKPEFSPRSIARAIWKRRYIALFVALGIATLGIGVTRRLPSLYRAEALVLVDPQQIPERFVSATVSQDFSDRLTTMSQEIMSSTRLKSIVDEFGLYPKERASLIWDEVIERMRRDIEIKVDKGVSGNRLGAFRILYVAPNAEVAAKVVNRITTLYIRENLKDRENQSESASAFLDIQLREAKAVLDEQEEAVTRYKLGHNGQLPQQENMLLVTAARLQVELQGNQDAINRAQQTKITRESALSAAQAGEAALTRRDNSRPTASITRAESRFVRPSDAFRSQLETIRLRYGDEHPDVRKLRSQLAEAQRREEEEGPAPPNTLASGAGSVGQPSSGIPRDTNRSSDPDLSRAHDATLLLRAQLDEAERELSLRTAERDRLVRELRSYQSRIENLPIREQEMASLTRDYDFSKSNYRSLLDKKIAADMATDLEKRQKAERFRILDPARPPERPFKPKRELFYGVSVVFGIALGALLAFGFELKQGVLLGRWELPLDIPVLVQVPRIESSLAAKANRSGRTLGTAMSKIVLLITAISYAGRGGWF